MGVLLAVLASGCVGEEVFETQTLVLAETAACELATATGARQNAYRVFLFELTESPDPDDPRVPCAACLEDGTCPIAQVECRCGGRVPPTTGAFNRELEGVRFSMLDPSGGYCVGLASFEVDRLPPRLEPASACACDFLDADLTGTSRACGVTPFPLVVEENAAFVPITVDCGAARCAGFE